AAPDVTVEVFPGVVEQALHGLASVVARDVGVKVLPYALDAVRVGTVRGQEVQDDAALERFEYTLRRARRVDTVVVEDEVDATYTGPIALVQHPQEVAEQRGALPCCTRRVQGPGANVERACQVELLVFPGGDDAALLAGEHPIAPDLGVEVDVDFV